MAKHVERGSREPERSMSVARYKLLATGARLFLRSLSPKAERQRARLQKALPILAADVMRRTSRRKTQKPSASRDRWILFLAATKARGGWTSSQSVLKVLLNTNLSGQCFSRIGPNLRQGRRIMRHRAEIVHGHSPGHCRDDFMNEFAAHWPDATATENLARLRISQ